MIHGEHCKNKLRAERGMKGLEFHAKLLDPHGQDYEREIMDFLIDLMHLCEQHNLNFLEILEDSIGNYTCEQYHENEECIVNS